ncbi:MAG TPA: ATP-binding protein [Solirubrobacteraceae bacterium]|nr:ATP-binding protein [Solirubrobacteraceae bacterium]
MDGDTLLALELPADATAPRAARRAIAPVVAEIGADTACIVLAVSEAVTNAVTHGYRGRPAGSVRVRAARREAELVVTVEDDGEGMPPQERTQNGFGLPTIEKLADEVAIDSERGGTRVVMRFPAQAVPSRH